MKTNLNVYEDGEKIGEVEVDVNDTKTVMNLLEEYFDCDELEDGDVDIEVEGDEVYIGVSEVQYFWSK